MRYLLLLLLFTSCSADWHLRRAILKDPTIIEQDTIHDTIITQGRVVQDSLILPKLRPCSVYVDLPIDQNGVIGVITIRGDEVAYYVECPSDTIYRTIPIEKIVYRTKEQTDWNGALWLVLAIVVVVLLIRIIPQK